jgi:hypothetical protein
MRAAFVILAAVPLILALPEHYKDKGCHRGGAVRKGGACHHSAASPTIILSSTINLSTSASEGPTSSPLSYGIPLPNDGTGSPSDGNPPPSDVTPASNEGFIPPSSISNSLSADLIAPTPPAKSSASPPASPPANPSASPSATLATCADLSQGASTYESNGEQFLVQCDKLYSQMSSSTAISSNMQASYKTCIDLCASTSGCTTITFEGDGVTDAGECNLYTGILGGPDDGLGGFDSAVPQT